MRASKGIPIPIAADAYAKVFFFKVFLTPCALTLLIMGSCTGHLNMLDSSVSNLGPCNP